MSRLIKVQLSTKGLAKWAQQVDNWSKRMDMAGKNIVNDLAQLAKSEMENNYNVQGLEASSGMSFEIEGNDYEKTVKMVGTQTIYHEFGTGTKGQENPHPKKNKFDLNEYNSGPTIRKASKEEAKRYSQYNISEGDLFWTYMSDDGTVIATQGIPSQKVVYNAMKTVRQELPKVAEKRLKEALE